MEHHSPPDRQGVDICKYDFSVHNYTFHAVCSKNNLVLDPHLQYGWSLKYDFSLQIYIFRLILREKAVLEIYLHMLGKRDFSFLNLHIPCNS